MSSLRQGQYHFGILSAKHSTWYMVGTHICWNEQMHKGNFHGIMTSQQLYPFTLEVL